MKSFIALLFLFIATAASAQSIGGEMWLQPVDDSTLAVMIATTPGSVAPQSFAFKLVLSRDAVTTLVGGNTYEVARVSIGLLGPWPLAIDFEPSVSILSEQGGKITATVAKGNLRLTGITLDPQRRRSAGH